ncbi:hypothetical protein [Burkholderia multivorans]|uniref:hypothetical protein n=1 Tax=Burkholderia multivorans TaxID=87883 RepID=UPI0020B20283|nr:hypothetical protein [Burkholderia multivorans]
MLNAGAAQDGALSAAANALRTRTATQVHAIVTFRAVGSRKSSPRIPKNLTLFHIRARPMVRSSASRAAIRPVPTIRLNICAVNSSECATIISDCGIAQRRHTGIGLQAVFDEAINNKESA